MNKFEFYGYRALTFAGAAWVWLTVVAALFWPIIAFFVWGLSPALILVGGFHFIVFHHFYALSKATPADRLVLSGGIVFAAQPTDIKAFSKPAQTGTSVPLDEEKESTVEANRGPSEHSKDDA